MISRKKLLQLARKWPLVTEIGRKRISFPRTSSNRNSRESNEAPPIKKGHFAVYSSDGGRFVIPLSYLGNGVIRELFAIAEEEFGIPGDSPSHPCDIHGVRDLTDPTRLGFRSGGFAGFIY